jgi:DNA polymerase-3 subunit gamma/tau
MPYEVTATRRRPKTFDELAGQEFVAATLKSSLESGRIAHAYLFSGPRGCGKTSAARILARSLNCEKGPTVSPCGVCHNCLEIARGASLDIIEIDGASNTGVNDVRAIKDEVLFPPNSSRYKVYIIDEVHMLSNNAFNALLKTIEEPPPYIVFIFATTELHKVPATIKSRCQQFAFRLIPIETIADILKKTCAEMRIEAEAEALLWVARESTGSLRDAYTLFDQVVSFSDGNIKAGVIREKLGLVGMDNLNALATACAENDPVRAFTLIDDLLNAGIAIEQFIIDMSGFYHSLLLIKVGITKGSLLSNSPDRFSPVVLQRLSGEQIEHALDMLLELYRNIRYSVSPRFELEAVVSKLCILDKWVSPLELRSAIAEARALLSTRTSNGEKKNFSVNERIAEEPYEGRSYDRQHAGDEHSGHGYDGQLTAAGQSGEYGESAAGSLTEGFKRYMEKRESAAQTQSATSDTPPQTERVLRVFHGTIVK